MRGGGWSVFLYVGGTTLRSYGAEQGWKWREGALIFQRGLDLREYVSLDFSFRAQYLYYISAVSRGRAAFLQFFRFPACGEVRIFMDAFPWH